MQGRFKRDSGAPGDPESRGGADRGKEPWPPADDAVTAAAGAAGQASINSAVPAKDSSSSEGSGDVDVPVTFTGPQARHASRLAMGNWSIRTRLVSLLALPVVAATTLGALRIQSSLDNVSNLDHVKLMAEIAGQGSKLADALQNERDSTAGPITSGHPKDDQVVASRQATDRAVQNFESATGDIKPDEAALIGVRSTVIDIERQLQTLKQLRDSAYAPTNTQYISQTVAGYDQLINSLISLTTDMAQATGQGDIISGTRALAAFAAAKEYESVQRAVISAALANPAGPQLSNSDRLYAQSAENSETSSLKRFSEVYGAGAAELLKPLNGGNTVISEADQYRARVLQTPNGISQENKSYLDWYDQANTKMQEMSRIEAQLLDQMQQKALTLRSSAEQDALINGAIILLVLGISLVGAFVVARSMIRSLRRLQDTAKDVAQKRLPELVRHLSESDPQDVDTSIESIGINTRDEIGQVARAFDDVHREAVRLAAEQALLRGNVNAMFTNLSRRSQGLIQRQLSLISELESREADPDQLSNLFKLDHLATRMRRNGENLLVLAGEEPGRRWTRPVPLVDVLRAAASEVEQYERIELTSVPPTDVAGRVVNDLVHLLAELLENATSFSSPQTKVRVTGHALPDGRVLIEIHDTGIGLSPEDLSDINERLANPPTVDVSVSRRMGLFVVGRLSQRHGIRIQLRPSDSGGTTALVMLPVDLTQGGKPAPGQGGKAGQGAGQAGGASVPPPPGRGGSPLGRAPQRQMPPGAQRPALAGNRDGGMPERGPARGPALPTRPTAEPAPARAQERTLPSWAQQEHGGADVPRGHDEDLSERTERFPRPQVPTAGADRATGEFPMPPGGAAYPDPSTTGEFPPPRSARHGEPVRMDNPADTARIPQIGGRGAAYPDPATTGEFAPPQSARHGDPIRMDAPAESPQLPQPGAGRGAAYPDTTRGGGLRTPRLGRPDAGQGQGQGHGQSQAPGAPGPDFFGGRPAGSGSDVFGPRPTGPGHPGGAPGAGSGSDLFGGRSAGSGSDVFAPRPAGAGSGSDVFGPRGGASPNGRQPGGQAPQPGMPRQQAGAPASAPPQQRRPEAQLPPVAEPMALPPASSPGDGRSPIFESLNSTWFRGRPEGGESPSAPPAAQQPPTPPTPPRQQSAARPPQRARAEGAGAEEWRVTPNDERWRRAEQVREPASGGVTSSGLPRRVPRANLVPGTATQSTQAGPQVSRAPDDVRGRLTNLRRGIQQGRSAGTGHAGARTPNNVHGGTPYQQER